MKDISQVHFRVIDHGIFLPVARRLAREAGRVTYWTPDQRAFPTVRDQIGRGFDDIERVEDIFEDKREVDCWVFPDIGFSGLQAELLSQRRLVWGARTADSLEINRGAFLDELSKAGLAVPPHQVVRGMAALRSYLCEQEDKWVKVSKYRGDWETLHFRNWDTDEMELDLRAVRLGPWKEEIEFYVFDKIETEIEDGCDTHCVVGSVPDLVLHGMEAKDKAYLGAFQKKEDLPEPLVEVLEAFGPILGEHDARTALSIEVRITPGGEFFFIDPTIRFGSPPHQVMCELIGNLGEIILSGAEGELVEPEPMARFGVQAILKFGREDDSWGVMELDPKLDQWVKSANAMRVGDRLFGPPENVTGCEDWLVGIGDTIKEAINHLKENIKLLPAGATCDPLPLVDLLREVDEAEDSGMEFTHQSVPDPGVVLEES